MSLIFRGSQTVCAENSTGFDSPTASATLCGLTAAVLSKTSCQEMDSYFEAKRNQRRLDTYIVFSVLWISVLHEIRSLRAPNCRNSTYSTSNASTAEIGMAVWSIFLLQYYIFSNNRTLSSLMSIIILLKSLSTVTSI